MSTFWSSNLTSSYFISPPRTALTTTCWRYFPSPSSVWNIAPAVRADLYNTSPQCSSQDRALSRRPDNGPTSERTWLDSRHGHKIFPLSKTFRLALGLRETPIGSGTPPPGVKQLNYSHPSTIYVKMTGAIHPLPLCLHSLNKNNVTLTNCTHWPERLLLIRHWVSQTKEISLQPESNPRYV
jgi:hypothetical protein